MQQRLFGFLQDVFPPRQELGAEVLPLTLVHERLFVARPIVLGLGQHPTSLLVVFFLLKSEGTLPVRGRLIYVPLGADNIRVVGSA
jgi:hypothetical protein